MMRAAPCHTLSELHSNHKLCVLWRRRGMEWALGTFGMYLESYALWRRRGMEWALGTFGMYLESYALRYALPRLQARI